MEYISNLQKQLNYSLRKYKKNGVVDDKTLYLKQKIEDLINDIESNLVIDRNKIYKRAKEEEEMKKIIFLGSFIKSNI